MPLRPSALTMPEVTVWPSPNGLPMAITRSPTSSRLESPNAQLGELLAGDAQQRHVGGGIAADQLGRELAAVLEGDGDPVGVGHDVVVGQDQPAAGIDDHARAGADRAALARLLAAASKKRRKNGSANSGLAVRGLPALAPRR